MTGRYDRWVLAIMMVLVAIGLVAVYSSTSVISPDVVQKLEKKGQAVSQFGFVRKQVLTMLLGIVALVIAARVPIAYVRKAAIPLLAVSLFLLLLVFTQMGISAGGARRWLRVWPSAFQPSELVKIAMVVFLAWYMSLERYRSDAFRMFLIPIGVMGAFQVVFLKQPDFGAVMSLGLLTLSLLFLSGVRLRYLLSLGVVAAPVLAKLISEPYRWKRVTAFLDPWKDPQGAGFQLIQSFIALGSGGASGVGLGEGKQKLSYLPEVHTDFIFSLIGEELGFIGAVFVVVLFFFLFLRGIAIARKAADLFSYYLAFGISVMLATQALVNFAVVTGMVPTKGLPLPFISYGGSSLIVSMVAIGLLLNISRGHQAVVGEEGIGEAERQILPVPPASSQTPAAHAAPQCVRWQRGMGYRHCRARLPREPGSFERT